MCVSRSGFARPFHFVQSGQITSAIFPLLFLKVSSLNPTESLPLSWIKLFKNFQGCFTVQLSRFSSLSPYRSNSDILSQLSCFVNNFFNFFQVFLSRRCRFPQQRVIYYHPLLLLSTPFFNFFQIIISVQTYCYFTGTSLRSAARSVETGLSHTDSSAAGSAAPSTSAEVLFP